MINNENQRNNLASTQKETISRRDYQENQEIVLPVRQNSLIRLGFLYDCRTDTVIPINIFRGEIPLDKFEWQSITHNESNWRQIENIEDRSRLLDIEGKMKLSLLNLGTAAGGSLKYMTKSSSNEETITVGVKSEVITGTLSVNPSSMALDTSIFENSDFNPTHYVGMVKCGGRLVAESSFRVLGDTRNDKLNCPFSLSFLVSPKT